MKHGESGTLWARDVFVFFIKWRYTYREEKKNEIRKICMLYRKWRTRDAPIDRDGDAEASPLFRRRRTRARTLAKYRSSPNSSVLRDIRYKRDEIYWKSVKITSSALSKSHSQSLYLKYRSKIIFHFIINYSNVTLQRIIDPNIFNNTIT